MEISFYNVRQSEGIFDELNAIKETIENKINLSRNVGKEKRVILTNNKVMRSRNSIVQNKYPIRTQLFHHEQFVILVLCHAEIALQGT